MTDIPVQAEAVGSLRQAATVARSLVNVVQVVEAHLPPNTAGMPVLWLDSNKKKASFSLDSHFKFVNIILNVWQHFGQNLVVKCMNNVHFAQCNVPMQFTSKDLN